MTPMHLPPSRQFLNHQGHFDQRGFQCILERYKVPLAQSLQVEKTTRK